ncbi:hypothetical protein ACFL6R_06785 [Gemmatimonadota bacterium]
MSLLRARTPLKALIGYRLRFVLLWIRNGFRARTILCYPGYPHKKTVLFKICREAGFNISTRSDRPFDLAIAWENVTWRDEYPELERIGIRSKVLNLNCRDISKSRLGEVFDRVFGYPLTVNPTTHEGDCAKKNDRNASKSGEIVHCPIAQREEGFAYHRLVRSDCGDGLLEEIRVPVIDGLIPMVFIKHKSADDRFRTNWLDVTEKTAQEVFSEAELEKIGEFCRAFGLDYGEIDVLRDVDDGRIYIVDANNTPWGPPRILPERHRRDIVRRQAALFIRSFLENREA